MSRKTKYLSNSFHLLIVFALCIDRNHLNEAEHVSNSIIDLILIDIRDFKDLRLHVCHHLVKSVTRLNLKIYLI